MKSLVVHERGKIEISETERPDLGRNNIRIKVQFAGVGFADVMAVRGSYIFAPKRPFSPGYEFAGVIAEVGSGVSGFRAGQRVAGMLPVMGCYREYIDIDPVWAVAVPDGVCTETAAIIPLNYLTALSMIDRYAALESGASFVIHGAAGGVGSAALELARHRNLRAFGTGSSSKLADIASLGATPIEMNADWLSDARRLCPEGFNAAFDSFGGQIMRDSFRSLGKNGTLVNYGFVPGIDGGMLPLAAGLAFHGLKKLLDRSRKTAICATPSIVKNNPAWYGKALAEIFTLADGKKIEPKLFDVVPFGKVRDAHQAIIDRKVRGKILLSFV